MDFTNFTVEELTELNKGNAYKKHPLHIQHQNLIREIDLKIAEAQSIIYEGTQKKLCNIILTEQERTFIKLGADAVIMRGLL